jgi:hypothetical protein
MQSFINHPFLDKRGKYARWGIYIGFGSLFVGLVTVTRSPILSYIFLLVGLLGATFGSYMNNRYVREPRVDQILDDALGGMDKRYTLYGYYLPSDYVVASHHGLTVVVPRTQEGEISYSNGRWQHKAGMRKLLQFFGEPSLGKPDQDLQQEMRYVKEWIDKVMTEKDIPVNGAVLFTNPKAVLKVSDAPAPSMTAAELVAHMKQGLKGQPTLSTALQTELRQALDEVVAAG